MTTWAERLGWPSLGDHRRFVTAIGIDAVGSGSRELELRLHPDDFGVLAPHLAGLSGVRLTADAGLGRGELRLNSEGVRIDGTLHARLQSVLEATLASGEGHAPAP